MVVANFTRFRPAVIPARKNSVRRCCLTVTDVETARDFVVAASLGKEAQHLLIAWRYFHGV